MGIGILLYGDFFLGVFQQILFDGRPPVECLAALAEVRNAEAGWSQVLAVNDHEFFAFLRIEQMNQADVHHSGRHVETFGANQGFHMLAVRAFPRFRILRTHPGINVEIQAADGGVPRGVVLMCEVGLAGKIAFELHPIKTLDILLRVGIDENMQFTIGDVVQVPAVRSHVLNGIWKLYAHAGIVRRNNDISFDLTFRSGRLERQKGREAN